jgi:hypothetical protein
MNRAEEIVSSLRRTGVSERQIAIVLGIEYQSLRMMVHRSRRDGTVFPAPAGGVSRHLERAIAALVHSLSGHAKLCGTDAALIITAHRTKLAMREAAAKLIAHNIVDENEVAWLLGHLGGSPSEPGGKIDTTLAA